MTNIFRGVDLATGVNLYKKKSIHSGASTATIAGGIFTLVSAAPGKIIVLDYYRIVVSGNAIRGVAGVNAYNFLYDPSPDFEYNPVYIPAVALSNSGVLFDSGLIQVPSGFKDTRDNIAGRALQFDGATALTGGSSFVNFGFHLLNG